MTERQPDEIMGIVNAVTRAWHRDELPDIAAGKPRPDLIHPYFKLRVGKHLGIAAEAVSQKQDEVRKEGVDTNYMKGESTVK